MNLDFLDDPSVTVGRQENYIASEEALTTPHGANILDTIQWYASEAIYDLHRIVVDGGDMKPSNCLKAMANIRDSSVDIVNISAGKMHDDCQQQCRLCDAAKAVAESGTVVVAAAGNDVRNDGNTMYCPALSDQTISVGSFESVCTREISLANGQKIYRPSLTIHPPGAYWIRDTKHASEGEPVDQPFCSCRNCMPGCTCAEYRKEQLSPQTIKFDHGEPDVFAPDHLIVERDNGEAGIERGSSYATAIVSGALAGVLSTLSEQRVLPRPEEVNRAISSINQTVGDTPHRRFDSKAVYYELL